MTPNSTLYALVSQQLAARPHSIALVEADRELTYAQLDRQAAQVQRWLYDQGVRCGDRVLVYLRCSIEEVVATLAITRAGGVFVNVFHQWTPEQLSFAASKVEARVLITDRQRARRIDKRGGLPAPIERVLVAGATPPAADPRVTPWASLPDLTEASASGQPESASATDLAAILFTSGSTGSPKGVMLSHRNLIAGARSVSLYLQNTESDRILGLLPLCFDYGLNQLTTALWAGGTLVLHSVPMPAEIVRTLKDKRVTGFAAVPPVWIGVVRYLQQVPTALPHLRYLTNSGGAIPHPTLDALPVVFPGVEVFLMYGLTEAFRATYLPPEEFGRKRGAIGYDVPSAETFLISTNPDGVGQVCAPGEEGELVQRGPLVSMGYWNDPEATAKKIRPCPALRDRIGDEAVCYSGDLVRLDADGCYWFVGRRDGLIKTNGIRISPTEVEDVCYRSGLVGSAVAFGVPHPELGKVIHVAASAPRGGDDLDEAALGRFLRDNLPSYMVPRALHGWAGELPRTASGKLDRAQIVRAATFHSEEPSDADRP